MSRILTTSCHYLRFLRAKEEHRESHRSLLASRLMALMCCQLDILKGSTSNQPIINRSSCSRQNKQRSTVKRHPFTDPSVSHLALLCFGEAFTVFIKPISQPPKSPVIQAVQKSFYTYLLSLSRASSSTLHHQ